MKRVEPIKAWAVVDANGNILNDYDDGTGTMLILKTKMLAKRWRMDDGERVIPVMIVPVEKKK